MKPRAVRQSATLENWLRHCWDGPEYHEETSFAGATKCDSWTTFVREVESIEHAKKTISAPTPMDIESFQGICHKCGKHGHTAKEFRNSSHGGAEKLQCALCGKKTSWTVLDTELHHKDSQRRMER